MKTLHLVPDVYGDGVRLQRLIQPVGRRPVAARAQVEDAAVDQRLPLGVAIVDVVPAGVLQTET